MKMPKVTTSIINNIIVVSVNVLGPEYHTYAVTFPASQTIEAGHKMVSY